MKEILGVSTFVRFLVQRLDPLAADRDTIKKIRSTLFVFDGVIGDAESKGTRMEVVNSWLLHLRDVLFDLNDLIDEMELEVQSHLQKNGGVSFSLSCLNPFSNKSRLVKAFNQSRYKLTELTNQMNMYGFKMEPNLPIESRGAITLRSSKPIASSGVIGRERDEMIIKDALLNHAAAADSGVLVIGILGIRGLGKTTLAQLIYNDPHIRSKFDITLWVVDARKSRYHILHQLRMQVMEQIPLNLDQDIKSLEQLEEELCRLLDMKRVLLVLDDRLPQSFLPPEQVYSLLQNATHGSVVIVTSRSEPAALAFRAPIIHYLIPISESDSYQLFTKHAFASNVEDQFEFVNIGKKLAQRCRGVPLFLKVIGELLCNKDDLHDWEDVLDKTDAFDGAQTVLKVINGAVPRHLKLPLCTLELQEVFSVEELICVWMALGFVVSDDPNQQPECVGRRYLRELYDCGLLVEVEFAPGGVVTDFGLHDVVKDIVTKTSFEQGFSRLRQDGILYDNVDNTTKYIVLEEGSLRDVYLLAEQYHTEKLQLFVLFPGKQVSVQILMNILSRFKSLRVLGLSGCSIEILPDFIGKLKHLRYLDVGRNELLSSLPDSICNLWHLQTLLLHGCHQLKKFPAGIGKLQNLRYLTLTTSLETLPEEIGQLTSLRTMGLYSCQCLISLPSSLKNLKKLQTLGIVDCPKVDLLASSSVEALRGMDDIDTLLLSGVPEFQHLPPNLGTPSVVMKHLLIQSSIKMSGIAWLNQFLYLHSLTIEDCPQLSTLAVDGNSQFNNMTELVIRNCPRLGDTNCVRQFASLRSFIIDGCPDLAALDAGFAELKKLERLEIRLCPVLIESIERDSSYVSHVQVIELNGVPFNKPSKSKNPVQEDDSYSGSAMDIASSSNHVMSNSLSASEILEDSS